jgi:DNA helicase-2/ATP-dependent DNA helicase PcrA
MEETVFPHARALDEDGIEEERRLCYVGMTRARERLILTRARHRLLFGNAQENPPSRFLLEIPASLVRRAGAFGDDDEHADGEAWHDDAGAREGRFSPGASRFVSRDAVRAPSEPRVDYSFSQETDGGAGFRPGTRVHHPDFGNGVVRRREGTGTGEKLTVQFERGGLKKLIARFAPLTIVAP